MDWAKTTVGASYIRDFTVLAYEVELWGVYSGDFWENWSWYNDIALYFENWSVVIDWIVL